MGTQYAIRYGRNPEEEMSDNWYGLFMASVAVGSGVLVGLLLDQAHTLVAKRRYNRKKIRK